MFIIVNVIEKRNKLYFKKKKCSYELDLCIPTITEWRIHKFISYTTGYLLHLLNPRICKIEEIRVLIISTCLKTNLYVFIYLITFTTLFYFNFHLYIASNFFTKTYTK